ncbi:hypothetical protein C5C31_08340 [Rathayibacter rathayi]|uniref:DUF2530 domain-containing protein n=1 Tax=Rathayibacter rathayi TaxID=33887 RepID=A0ABX5ACD6_RATRA|nr:hypothetical protein C5C34_12485 [Rathayibacter rathayi]PPF49710.1 hypothetical protein C5C08_06570 [Rathayibacter rathayi]PPF75470.1 hypothetical protein C5C14_13870 [Rathayibacter rathayi]PPG11641.1 hypothetical protein C5C11_11830 [Rathayibacter rathayi]PPG44475.1 hypothetical protein C5C20_06840 [Rathayibacter rathayi]
MLNSAERPHPTLTIAVVLGAGLLALPLIRNLELPWNLVASAAVGLFAGGIVYGIQLVRIRRRNRRLLEDETGEVRPPTRE